jgi:hypothetical protein
VRALTVLQQLTLHAWLHRICASADNSVPACAVHLQATNSVDDDFLDYNNELRIGILEAYSGIFQGLGPGAWTAGWLSGWGTSSSLCGLALSLIISNIGVHLIGRFCLNMLQD